MLSKNVRGEEVFFETDISYKTTYSHGLLFFLDKNDLIEKTELVIPTEKSVIDFNRIGIIASTNSLDYLSKYIPSMDTDLSMNVDSQLARQYRKAIFNVKFPKIIHFTIVLDSFDILLACRRAYYLIYSTKFENVDISLDHGFIIRKANLGKNAINNLNTRDTITRSIIIYMYNHNLCPKIEFTYRPKFNFMDKMSIKCNDILSKFPIRS